MDNTITITPSGIAIGSPLIAGTQLSVTATDMEFAEGATIFLIVTSRFPDLLIASCPLSETTTEGEYAGTLYTATKEMVIFLANARADEARPATIELVDTAHGASLARTTVPIYNSSLIPQPCKWPSASPLYVPGRAATVLVGTTQTLPPGSSASVENAGTSSDAVLNFGIPQGVKGDAATIAVGTTQTLPPGSDATVTNSGTSAAAVLNFGIPRGGAATVAVGTTTTLAPGSSATVENAGTSSDAVLNFGIPRGGAATISVGTTTTLPPGSSATVENVGTPSAAILNFGVPQGAKGDPKPSDADPLMDGAASPGVSPDYSRTDHTHPTDITRASVADLNPALAAVSATDAASTAALADRTITSVDVAASVGSLALSFPTPVAGRARDFSARLLCRGSGLSTISLPSGETVDFGAGEIANVCNTPGISLVRFAEIAAGRWSISASVPPEPVAVDWVDFTGTQYVDTGLAPGNNELDFEIVCRNIATNGTTGMFGCREATDSGVYVPSNYSAFIRPNNNGEIRADIANNGSAVFLPLRNIADYTITWSAASRTIAASYRQGQPPGTATARKKSSNAFSFVIGGINTAGTIVPGAELRLYSATFSRAGVTLLDLSPVRIGSSGFLLDSISGSLYGSGDLVPGPDTNA